MQCEVFRIYGPANANADILGQFSVISNAFLILPLFDKPAVNICICLGVFIDIFVCVFLSKMPVLDEPHT